MKFINCTPHPITVVAKDGTVILALPKGEIVPRLAQSTKIVDTVGGIDIAETQFGELENMPNPADGVVYVVSRLVLSAAVGRTDLVVPNELARDGNGNILGCYNFARN